MSLPQRETKLALSPDDFYRPLHPEPHDQGDPYILTLPRAVGARFRFYTYVTGEDAASQKAFPVYGSNDLVHWESLGGTLVADMNRSHWAPCVQFIPSLAYPYVMLYSRGEGLDERAHIGHGLRRAHSRSPEGPFLDSGEILTSNLDFAIDADVYYNRVGELKIAFAADFVEDEPLGTGIVESSITPELTELTGRMRVLARAKYEWQVYDRARRMPWKKIPGVNWETDRVRWYTIEGPVGGLVSPQGRQVYLYSGGCFFEYYGVGQLIENEKGELVDVSSDGNLLVAPSADDSFIAPGHCSLVRGIGDRLILMLHARFNGLASPRQICLVPLEWTDKGQLRAIPRDAVLET